MNRSSDFPSVGWFVENFVQAIADLEDGLRPFVSGSDQIPDVASDDGRASISIKPKRGRAVTIGEVRRAVRLLAKDEGGRNV